MYIKFYGEGLSAKPKDSQVYFLRDRQQLPPEVISHFL